MFLSQVAKILLLANVSHRIPYAIINKSYLIVVLLVSGNVIYSWPQLS